MKYISVELANQAFVRHDCAPLAQGVRTRVHDEGTCVAIAGCDTFHVLTPSQPHSGRGRTQPAERVPATEMPPPERDYDYFVVLGHCQSGTTADARASPCALPTSIQ